MQRFRHLLVDFMFIHFKCLNKIFVIKINLAMACLFHTANLEMYQIGSGEPGEIGEIELEILLNTLLGRMYLNQSLIWISNYSC